MSSGAQEAARQPVGQCCILFVSSLCFLWFICMDLAICLHIKFLLSDKERKGKRARKVESESTRDRMKIKGGGINQNLNLFEVLHREKKNLEFSITSQCYCASVPWITHLHVCSLGFKGVPWWGWPLISCSFFEANYTRSPPPQTPHSHSPLPLTWFQTPVRGHSISHSGSEQLSFDFPITAEIPAFSSFPFLIISLQS